MRAIAERILCLVGLWDLHYNSVHVHVHGSARLGGLNNEGKKWESAWLCFLVIACLVLPFVLPVASDG